ncbi:bifunctional 2-polyprenyl-6-hydroxyphenol methylase/3-demethylubiquinol 3-O-methyltransferase UbiG [Desulfopila sp. IMCC35008]|uniref:class I SAM-dependent methyltransferase n=1 Tax=Desulfopila sp. IMCC35008 TaxID=2653858 RepID=UPI0013D0F01D|nr:methyltransferase domain-containing protein [Desulfopila sp. IMCC35008]
MARIFDKMKDPLGKMLLEYHRGDSNAFLTAWSDSQEMSPMRGDFMFRHFLEMEELDKLALAECRGRVLDVGGGSGCHSLALQILGLEVDAIDISPGCVAVMEERGVKSVRHLDLHELETGSYNTVLMLMNGAGLCGTLDGLNLFLEHAGDLLAPGGQVLVDSTDLTADCGKPPEDDERYPGETEFVMIYKVMRSDPFSWLYIDFDLLKSVSTLHGWQCYKLLDAKEDRFLARLTKD